jgi:AMP-binding enzyme
MMVHTLTGLVEYGPAADPRSLPTRRRLRADDAHVPRARLGCPYTATLSGCKIVFAGRYTPEIFLKLTATEKVTFTHCVPNILQMLLSAPGSDKVDLSGLKMIVGGSALPPALPGRRWPAAWTSFRPTASRSLGRC